MTAKIWIALGAEFLVFAVLLFGGAGTLVWPAAWAFLSIFFGLAILITNALARDDPALLAERMKPVIQEGQPLWDKIIMVSFVVLFAGWLILMGIDAGRLHWRAMPVALQWLGAGGIVVSLWICHTAFRANPFLVNVVKIQNDRGHKVVSGGPYGIVRHPLYAGIVLFLPMTALLLGSWLGVIGAFFLMGALILRTALEDRELHARLDGYRNYAQRVRYRLIPLVW